MAPDADDGLIPVPRFKLDKPGLPAKANLPLICVSAINGSAAEPGVLSTVAMTVPSGTAAVGVAWSVENWFAVEATLTIVDALSTACGTELWTLSATSFGIPPGIAFETAFRALLAAAIAIVLKAALGRGLCNSIGTVFCTEFRSAFGAACESAFEEAFASTAEFIVVRGVRPSSANMSCVSL